MDIVGIFQLSRGTTAFVGNIEGRENMIVGSKALLIVDGKPYGNVDELNEAITNKRTNNNYRSLETHKQINLTQDFIDKHQCQLVELHSDRKEELEQVISQSILV